MERNGSGKYENLLTVNRMDLNSVDDNLGTSTGEVRGENTEEGLYCNVERNVANYFTGAPARSPPEPANPANITTATEHQLTSNANREKKSKNYRCIAKGLVLLVVIAAAVSVGVVVTQLTHSGKKS